MWFFLVAGKLGFSMIDDQEEEDHNNDYVDSHWYMSSDGVGILRFLVTKYII